jgi:microcystin-dependent protein
MNIGKISFDGKIMRSNNNLTNVSSSIINISQPKNVKVINNQPTPFSFYNNKLSLKNNTSNIVIDSSPKNIKPTKSSFKPVIVPISSSSSPYNFLDNYEHTNYSNNQTITKEIITKQVVTKQIINQPNNMPSGTIIQFINSNPPEGWLLCDGTEVPINDFISLYNVIQNTFGDSNNGYFKLPDFRGRVPVGAGQGFGLSKRNLGELGGEEKHKLTISEMPIHNHNGTTLSAGNHTHNVNDPGHEHIINSTAITGNNTVSNTFNKNDRSRIDNKNLSSIKTNKETTDISLGPNGDHTHTFTTNNSGGGQEHNIMQPYIVTNYIIKI